MPTQEMHIANLKAKRDGFQQQLADIAARIKQHQVQSESEVDLEALFLNNQHVEILQSSSEPSIQEALQEWIDARLLLEAYQVDYLTTLAQTDLLAAFKAARIAHDSKCLYQVHPTELVDSWLKANPKTNSIQVTESLLDKLTGQVMDGIECALEDKANATIDPRIIVTAWANAHPEQPQAHTQRQLLRKLRQADTEHAVRLHYEQMDDAIETGALPIQVASHVYHEAHRAGLFKPVKERVAESLSKARLELSDLKQQYTR